MSFIKTIVVRAVLERATPIFCRENATPRFRRGSPLRSRPASVVNSSHCWPVTPSRGKGRKVTVGKLQARIVNQCEICRG